MILFSAGNLWLFTIFHTLVGQSACLDYAAIFFADYVQYFIAGWFFILLVYPKNRFEHRILVILSVLAAGIARLVIKPIILLLVAEPRPFVYFHFVPLVAAAAGEDFQSFPSGHALFFFALAMTTYLSNKKYGLYLFVLAIIMGFARVYVGVHWPFDILCGALLGIVVGYATQAVYRRYEKVVSLWVHKLETLYPWL